MSPRDRWSCVLPRWQLNVNVNHGVFLQVLSTGPPLIPPPSRGMTKCKVRK